MGDVDVSADWTSKGGRHQVQVEPAIRSEWGMATEEGLAGNAPRMMCTVVKGYACIVRLASVLPPRCESDHCTRQWLSFDTSFTSPNGGDG